jgi:pimeloyl-ACP methyl ester carboxylesterase
MSGGAGLGRFRAGRALSYGVSGEDLGPRQLWAVNVHGLSDDGRAYIPESEYLSAMLGWRVVTPCLPGFGASPGLPPCASTIEGLADALGTLLDELELGQVVLLGHSMGGAVVMRLAADRPDRTAGIIYRDGCATAAWRTPRLSVLAAPAVENGEAVAAGTPFAAWSALVRVCALCWSPGWLRLATSLARVDLTSDVEALARTGLPMLCVWGRNDLIAPRSGADQFCAASGSDVIWMQGGHFWMHFRPRAQAAALRDDPAGRGFVERVNRRALSLCQQRPSVSLRDRCSAVASQGRSG